MTDVVPHRGVATVRGRVDAVFYASPKFSAGSVLTPEGRTIRFAGSLMVKVNDAVVLHGTWETHATYGRQIRVAHFEFDQRMDAAGLAHYLANHPAMKGIGPARAARIAAAFAEDFDQVIDEAPERIAREARVPLEAINALRREWLRTRTLNTALTWLSSFGLTHHQVTKLVEKLENSVVTVLQTDPYILIREVPGFGFKRVDVVARKMGIAKDDPSRLRAGVHYCVTERLDQGDCWVDFEELLELANALLVLDDLDSRARIETALDALIDESELSCTSVGGRFLVALPRIQCMEADLAAICTEQVGSNFYFTEDDIDRALTTVGADLNAPQREALYAAATHNLLLISGGAGSGKTYTIAAIARMYLARGMHVALAAPTGKAAKRMEEVVGRSAKTIHRLLGFDGDTFKAGPETPLEAHVVIVDEVSMVDVPLAWALFRAIALRRTCVVLVGDHNQLPPVGPGNLLRDLIERRPLPTVILDHVVRQAGVLKENSIAVLRGEVRPSASPVEAGRCPPWVVISRQADALETQRYVRQLFDGVLAERLFFNLLDDVQLLTPTRKGPLGTEALNVLLQRLIQRKLWGVDAPPPLPGRRPEFLLHDRVIQMRNDYGLGVMNGAIGRVIDVGEKRGELTVRFDQHEVICTPENGGAGNLSLAYALTIHKAQGSEFPCVVAVVHKAHSFMHHRNLLYTAVTRAQQMAILMGDPWGLRNCAQKEELERRKTFLSVVDLDVAAAAPAGAWG